jgi:hypothetical protein
MTGIQFITDDKGAKTAAVIDLKTHRALWEEIEDVLVSRSRKNERGIPLAKVKAGLIECVEGTGEASGQDDSADSGEAGGARRRPAPGRVQEAQAWTAGVADSSRGVPGRLCDRRCETAGKRDADSASQ